MIDSFTTKLWEKLEYKPWAVQREGHASNARFKALFAGARYGKSLWGAKEVLPDILKPNTRGWLIGPTYNQPSKEFRYIYEDICLKLKFKPQKSLNLKYSSPGPQGMIMPWGSEVWTKSEENQNSLLGEELDWIILCEGSRLKEATYNTFLRARLGTRQGRVVVPTTPNGYNWLYKRFYLNGQADPDYWSKIVSVKENLLFPEEEYEIARKELPPEIFEEQYEGRFVAYTGLIYKRFSHDIHVINFEDKPPPVDIHPKWQRYMSIDPHPQTPAAVMWIAIDDYGTMYIYDEMFIRDLQIPEIANMIRLKECEHYGTDRHEKIDSNYKRLIDPNAKFIDKLRGQTASIKMQFAEQGIYCMEANNKFEHAYYKISELLTPKPVYGEEDLKKPRLFVFNTCKETIHEFLTCDWDNEKDNHMLDNLKYIVNDSPIVTFMDKDEEEEEDALLKCMNPLTGY